MTHYEGLKRHNAILASGQSRKEVLWLQKSAQSAVLMQFRTDLHSGLQRTASWRLASLNVSFCYAHEVVLALRFLAAECSALIHH